MIAIKAIEMQHNNSSGGNNHLQQQQQQLQLQQQQLQQHNLRDNYNVWGNNNGINANALQLQLQQQQQRAGSWINECNKQRHININNNSNHNNMNVNYNQHLTQQAQQQQQQQQPQYMQQATYNNYTQQQQPQQQLVPATTSQSSNCYYQCVQQQQQQQFLSPTTTSAAVSSHQQHQNQQQAHQQTQQQQRQDYSPAQAGKYILDHQPRHLGTFDGIQSAPTLTTPTLTPTTMRSIEESFYEMTNDPVTAPYQAGFKPPPLAPLVNNVSGNGSGNGNGVSGIPTTTATATVVSVVNPLISQQAFDVSSVVQGTDSGDSNSSWGDGHNNDDQDTDETSSAHTDSTSYQNGHMLTGSGANGGVNNFSNVLAAVNSGRGSSGSNTNTSNSATPARRGGGRRPNRSANMTPEEEEKRRIRRERNKQAAARCRKRRVDQTNELTEEVEQLEKKGDQLRKEMESLTEVKKQLAYFLQAHRPTCSKVRADLLSVNTCNGLIAPVGLLSAGSCGSGSSSHHNNNSNDSSNGTITGMDATLNSTGRSNSPLDLKPPPLANDLLLQIKDEPLDGGLDSSSSLDQDGPPPSKRFAPLPPMSTMPHMSTLMTPTGASSGSLQTPMSGTAPSGFGSAFPVVTTTTNGSMNSPTLNALNKVPKERPNTLAVQRPFGNPMHLTMPNKAGGRTEIQGVPIQTPSTGVFNFDSLMDGGTGLTPVSGPLVPNSSSQNKHPLELPTPTAEPSKLVSL